MDFMMCPRCGSPTEKAIAMNDGPSEFWKECTKCNTYINTYKPLPHQHAFHSDSHKFKGNFGGYGSGKTLTDRQEVYKHVFITPGGNTLIGANVSSQYEQTIKRDIEGDLPKAFVKYVSAQKSFIQLINDHRIIYRPFDDPNKLRSLNLSMFVILEGSEVNPSTYEQLKTRLRNTAASVFETDSDGNVVFDDEVPIEKVSWTKGLIESNPDSGWIKQDVLNVSEEIHKHGTIMDEFEQLDDEIDPATSSHITSSDLNKYLPKNFLPDMMKNKPMWWTARYVYGSFSYAEGLVYPMAMKCVVPPFDIPHHWKRICAFDYGLSDNSCFLFGAVDEDRNKIVIYKEVVTNNKNVAELSALFFEASKDIPVGGWVVPPLIDPKSAPKRDYNKKSLADHFLDYGIAFAPGHINLDARIFRLNTYIESGHLEIFSDCRVLIGELKDYKFKPKQLGIRTTEANDKPMDKNNHSINPLKLVA